jgi:hypothetical protein
MPSKVSEVLEEKEQGDFVFGIETEHTGWVELDHETGYVPIAEDPFEDSKIFLARASYAEVVIYFQSLLAECQEALHTAQQGYNDESYRDMWPNFMDNLKAARTRTRKLDTCSKALDEQRSRDRRETLYFMIIRSHTPEEVSPDIDERDISALASIDVGDNGEMVVSHIVVNPREINHDIDNQRPPQSAAMEAMLVFLEYVATEMSLPLDTTKVHK